MELVGPYGPMAGGPDVEVRRDPASMWPWPLNDALLSRLGVGAPSLKDQMPATLPISYSKPNMVYRS